ncbi:MAG: arginine--tRNA ligase [Planctomycetota bacterium]
MNHLKQHISKQLESVLNLRDQITAGHEARKYFPTESYAWFALEAMLNRIIRDTFGVEDAKAQLELIHRDKFGGDVALKVPRLLQAGGPKQFIGKYQPALVQALRGPEYTEVIASVDVKGMYINLRLTDQWIMQSAQSIIDLSPDFLRNETMAGQNVLVDYSSPNIAKQLHAGHIRSTIVGHVLSNLYDACGACVYRVNHVNDFGGFGFILEGYRRFHDLMPQGLPKSDRLIEIYAIRRSLERIVVEQKPAGAWTESDQKIISRYFSGTNDLPSVEAVFREFNDASDQAFRRLERGNPEEVELWQRVVRWGLDDFALFYEELDISIDFLIGESFYLFTGLMLIEQALNQDKAVLYTEEKAKQDLALVDRQMVNDELSKEDGEAKRKGILKDIGATLVSLDSGERFVLLRSDGQSIYATRDLGAIHKRNEVFDPNIVIYVVGQEQQVHFKRLFEAAEQLDLVPDGVPLLKHVYFGFYVDSATGKKLSSRDSVSNVYKLIELSKQYFYDRIEPKEEMSDRERAHAAHELTIGSLVFNDLKQDIKGAVDINVATPEDTVRGFEQSGGAYVVYAVCRARSILRQHGAKPMPLSAIDRYELSNQEAHLLLTLQLMPDRVIAATLKCEPTILIRHLLDVAKQYNSYYASAPVICDGVANPARLLITHAVELAINSGLNICHVKCPDRI